MQNMRQLVPYVRRDPPPGVKENDSAKDSGSREKGPVEWAVRQGLGGHFSLMD